MTTKTTKRHFGLSTSEIKQHQEQYAVDQKFPNPHNQGCYRLIIAALVNLGVDQRRRLAERAGTGGGPLSPACR